MFSLIVMTVKGVLLLWGATYAFSLLLKPEHARWVRGAPTAAFVGMYALGMVCHEVWIVNIALILVIALVPKSRAEAAALYSIVILSAPVLYQHLSIGSAYLFPVNKYTFCSLGLLAAMARLPREAGPINKRFDLPILLFLLLSFAESRNQNVNVTLRLLLPVLLSVAVPYFAISRSIKSRESMVRLVLAIALGGFVMACVAIVETRLHWLIYKQVQTSLDIVSSINPFQKLRGGALRAPASFNESTGLALYLTFATLAMLASSHWFATRTKWMFALAVMVGGLLAANSRGAFIALAIGVLVYDLYRGKFVRVMIEGATAMVVYAGMLVAASFSPYFLEMVGQGSSAGSTDYRWLLWHRGLEEMARHPLTGTSLQTALLGLEDLRQGEGIIDLVNGYVKYGLVAGIPGIIMLLLVFVTLAGGMLIARRDVKQDPAGLDSAAFVCACATFSIVSTFYGGFGGDSSTVFYQVAAVGAALYALRFQLRSSPADAPSLLSPSRNSIVSQIAADREAARRRRVGLAG